MRVIIIETGTYARDYAINIPDDADIKTWVGERSQQIAEAADDQLDLDANLCGCWWDEIHVTAPYPDELAEAYGVKIGTLSALRVGRVPSVTGGFAAGHIVSNSPPDRNLPFVELEPGMATDSEVGLEDEFAF